MTASQIPRIAALVKKGTGVYMGDDGIINCTHIHIVNSIGNAYESWTQEAMAIVL